MKKNEVAKFMKKIKAYYPSFEIEQDYITEEWYNKLKDYSYDDVLKKFDEHLDGELSASQPKLHFLTKYLKTEEEKMKAQNDYLIRCNLCGKEMYLSTYDNEHYSKCLLIHTLIPVLTERGEKVNYDILDEYDYNTLDKIYMKYVPLKKNLDDIKKALGGK